MTDEALHLQPVVVVGVDGSDSSRGALAWAAEEALARHATLLAVIAWHIPVLSYGPMAPIPVDIDLSAEATDTLRRMITEVLGASPAVPVQTRVIESLPADALLEASKDAAVMVVGRSGHGELAGMLIGSVSSRCVAHAACPVVVVPPSTEQPIP